MLDPKILVIRLGALGDLVFCFQAFADIRAAHPDAEIALLVRAPFADFARSLPWFDKIIIDDCPSFGDVARWFRLRRAVKNFAPNRIYDLQGKMRQSVLFALLGGPLGPEWSGAAPLCSHPRLWPPEPDMHFRDFLAAQLRRAGIATGSPLDVSWLNAPAEKFNLPEKFAVLVPGCSATADYKRWPAESYAALADALATQGLTCVAIGTTADAEAVAALKAEAPEIVDLGGQTNLFELAGIFRRAACVIGNDTGPVHLAAAVGAPVLILLSGRTNPVWSKPPGKRVLWRQSDIIEDVAVDVVLADVKSLLLK